MKVERNIGSRILYSSQIFSYSILKLKTHNAGANKISHFYSYLVYSRTSKSPNQTFSFNKALKLKEEQV